MSIGDGPQLTVTSSALVRSETYRLVGTSDRVIASATVQLNGSPALVLDVDGAAFSSRSAHTLIDGRNEFRIDAVDGASDTSITWWAVQLRALEVESQETRMLHMFPLGMRPQ